MGEITFHELFLGLVNAKIAYIHAKDDLKRPVTYVLPKISESAEYTYLYAKDVVKGPDDFLLRTLSPRSFH